VHRAGGCSRSVWSRRDAAGGGRSEAVWRAGCQRWRARIDANFSPTRQGAAASRSSPAACAKPPALARRSLFTTPATTPPDSAAVFPPGHRCHQQAARDRAAVTFWIASLRDSRHSSTQASRYTYAGHQRCEQKISWSSAACGNHSHAYSLMNVAGACAQLATLSEFGSPPAPSRPQIRVQSRTASVGSGGGCS